MKRFRADRIGSLLAGETPLPITPNLVVIHLMPQTSFDSPLQIDLRSVKKRDGLLFPIGATGVTTAINFNGVIGFSPGIRLRANERISSYVQVFRDGCIEAACGVRALMLEEEEEGQRFLPIEYEGYVEFGVRNYMRLLEELRVELPIFLGLTLVKAGGYRFAASDPFNQPIPSDPFRDDVMIIPEVQIEAYSADYYRVLKEPFDRVWQAVNRFGSPNYDQAGRWTGFAPDV